MKKILAILMVAIAFTSCDSDDDTEGSADASIVGTFVLTDFSSPFNDDYNGDGTTSTNLLVEVPCFMNSITFDADANYSSTATSLLLDFDDEGNVSAVCEGPFIETGTYSLDGDTLSITQSTTTDPDGEVDIVFNNATTVVTAEGLTLTVDIRAGNAVFVYDRQ